MADDNGKPRPISSGLYVKHRNGLKVRDEKTRRLVRRMRNVMPWLEESDIPSCRAWAQLEILADQAFSVLRAMGLVNGQGEPRRLLTDYRQIRTAQLGFANALGMTPSARQALKTSRDGAAFDLASDVTARAVAISEERGAPSGPPHDRSFDPIMNATAGHAASDDAVEVDVDGEPRTD